MSNKARVTAAEGQSIITIERTFDAPREKVFKAFTQSELIARWWGVSGNARVEENDPVEGGKWRFVEPSDQGNVTFFGVYHEVTAPERIVQTTEFKELGERGHAVLDRTVFTEEDGRTLVTTTEVFLSVEDRDGMLQSGMEEGLQQSYDQLDKILEEME